VVSGGDALGLPDGEGRQILVTVCSSCHALDEVTKFAGYYGKDQWTAVVTTMIGYGVALPSSDVPVLVDYLTENLGTR